MGLLDTPPNSPAHLHEPQDFDVDIEEVIELSDNEGTEEQYNEESELMEEDSQYSDDMASLTFNRHQGSVFCCMLNLSGEYAVTGGEDDSAYVWNTKNGEIYLHCTNHKDSVTNACFSHDDQLLATGDMSGYIQVWKMTTKTKIWDFETADLLWLLWHPLSHVLLAGTADGTVWMWKLPQGDTKTLLGPNQQADCGKVLPDGKRALAAYGDGSVRLFDLKSGSTMHIMKTQEFPSSTVTCMDASNGIVVTGSVDGTAKLFTTSTGKLVSVLACSDVTSINNRQQKVSEEEDDDAQIDPVESVAMCISNPSLLATATLKGKLSIWDVTTQVERHSCRLAAGIVKLLWDPSLPLVYAAILDGSIRLIDARTGQQISQWTGHTGEVLDLALSKNGSVMVTASDDGSSKIFNLTSPER